MYKYTKQKTPNDKLGFSKAFQAGWIQRIPNAEDKKLAKIEKKVCCDVLMTFCLLVYVLLISNT